jgi:hypothetical protein
MVTPPNFRRGTLVPAIAFLLTTFLCASARASGVEEPQLDLVGLVQLQHEAERAKPADQCYLYIQLLHGLTELAAQQMRAGEMAEAGYTVRQMDAVVVKVHEASGRDAKRLKNSEQLMEHVTRRFGDMVRVAATPERDAMQATLQKLNGVQSSLLAMVLSH